MSAQPPIKVYYDAACPRCVRDRARYRHLAGRRADSVVWLDANEQQEALRARDIEPEAALRSLHVEDREGHIHHGLDAYILLMEPVPLLRPLARFLGLPNLRRFIDLCHGRPQCHC